MLFNNPINAIAIYENTILINTKNKLYKSEKIYNEWSNRKEILREYDDDVTIKSLAITDDEIYTRMYNENTESNKEGQIIIYSGYENIVNNFPILKIEDSLVDDSLKSIFFDIASNNNLVVTSYRINSNQVSLKVFENIDDSLSSINFEQNETVQYTNFPTLSIAGR